MDVGEDALILARFPEPECESSPVSALSASASGPCESRDRRRRTLLEGDCSFSGKVDERGCCVTRVGFGLSLSGSRDVTSSGGPSTLPVSVFTSATDDMDDCDIRGLPAVLGPEEDVVVEETEFEAA